MIYEIKSNCLTAKINTLGAEFISLVKDGKDEYIYQPTDLWIGQAKNQFPNVAIAKDDYAIIKGQKYLINQHGFLKLMELSATPIAPNEIEFVLESGPATKAWYPYDFIFTIHFCLEGDKLTQTYTVQNKDADTMYFGVSCHTGYHATPESYIDFGSSNTGLIELLRPDRLYMSGEETPFALPDGRFAICPETLGSGARILRGFSEKQVRLVNPSLGTAVVFGFEGFPYLTLWSTDDASEFVCIMPWHALPDYADTNHIFEEKQGNIALPKGESFVVKQHFTFQTL